MKEEGFHVKIDQEKTTMSITGQLMDAKGRIAFKTRELVDRTVQLNKHYQNQMQFLNSQTSGPAIDGTRT